MPTPFRSIVGALRYPSEDRQSLQCSAGKLCRELRKPTEYTSNPLKHVERYFLQLQSWPWAFDYLDVPRRLTCGGRLRLGKTSINTQEHMQWRTVFRFSRAQSCCMGSPHRVKKVSSAQQDRRRQALSSSAHSDRKQQETVRRTIQQESNMQSDFAAADGMSSWVGLDKMEGQFLWIQTCVRRCRVQNAEN